MDIQPHRPQGGTNPGRPISGGTPNPRPLMNDFAPRRAAQPGLPPRPVVPPQPISQPVPPPKPTPLQPQPVAHPTAHHQPIAAPRPQQLSPQPAQRPPQPQPQPHHPEQLLESGELEKLPATTEADSKAPKQRSSTGHAGLVGWGVFALLTILFVLPIVPGKVLDNFPGSSVTSSSGEQSLACAQDISDTKTVTKYTTKTGAPLVYKYATTTTLTGTCNGKPQSVVGGTTSQFSPLALLADIALAAGIAVLVSIVWRKIFGKKS